MRRWLAVLLALAVVLIAGDTASWLWATGRLRQYEEAWAAARRAEGWTIATGPPERAGWPLSAALVLPGTSIATPAAIRWQAARVVLRVSLWNPYVLRIVPGGEQRAGLGDGPAFAYSARALSVTVPLDGSATGDLLARDLTADLGAGPASVTLLTAHVDPTPGGWAIAASARAIGLPPAIRWPLGPRIALASARATLAQTLAVQHVAFDWGPLAVAGHATFTLDPARQPEGDGVFQLTGYGKALDAGVAARAIAPGAAMATRAALALLAQASNAAPSDAAGDRVTVPAGLHDQTLTVAGIPVAQLPELAW